MWGLDLFNLGSGLLGGLVNYCILGVDDIVFFENNWGVLLKNSYVSKNCEWIYMVGVGYKDEKFDMVLFYFYCDGYEMKSNGIGEVIWGCECGVFDFVIYKNCSYLVKFGYFIMLLYKVSFLFNV